MEYPIRVLHVVVNMNMGGAETLLMNLYRNLDRSKIQFDFLTCKEGIFDDEIKEMGGVIHRIPYITNVGHSKYIRELKLFFGDKNKYKIIHSHLDKMSGLVLRAAKQAEIPIRISHSHNTHSEGGIIARLYKWYIGLFISQNATNFFSCSSQSSRWLFGKNKEKAILFKNGIDHEKYKYSSAIRKNVRKEFGLAADSFVVGHIGRFCNQKNHKFLIDIFAEICVSKPNSILILVGDGPLKDDINEKVKQYRLIGKVKFLGIRNDVNKLLQTFDVLIFPSFHEGLPVTLIEAQAASLPCVISSNISEEVDIGAGLITSESLISSPKKWAEKTLQLKRGTKDISKCIKNARFDIKESADWLQKYYITLTMDFEKKRRTA